MLFRGKCSFKALVLEKHNEQLDAYNDVYHSYFHVWSEIGLIFGLAMIWDRKSVGFQHLQSQPSPPLATKKPLQKWTKISGLECGTACHPESFLKEMD